MEAIAAHQTREPKLDVSHEEMQQRHQEVAERFGNQPTQVVEAAEHRLVHHVEDERERDDVARRAVTFARDRNLEREAVVEERAILRDALQRSLGGARMDEIKQEVDRRVERGEFTFTRRVEATVALHSHRADDARRREGLACRRLLEAVPGIKIVEFEADSRFGRSCSPTLPGEMGVDAWRQMVHEIGRASCRERV